MHKKQKLVSDISSQKSSQKSLDSQQQLQTIFSPKIDRNLLYQVDHKNITLNIAFTNYPIVKQVADKLNIKTIDQRFERNWDICWTDHIVHPETFIRMHFFQTINYIPGIQVIARKDQLGRRLNTMKKVIKEEFSFYPETWMIPEDYSVLRKYIKQHSDEVFIAKPEADCQGRGIFLINKLSQLVKGRHYVIQKYIQNPLLIESLKFDLRIYVLIGSIDPLKIYFYDEGLARFATQKYQTPDTDNFKMKYLHLTNYAVNKLNPKFGACQSGSFEGEKGYKRSLSHILKLLKQKGNDVDNLMKKIKDISIKTIITSYQHILGNYIKSQPEQYHNHMAFHILGIDIIVDQSFEPYILEVNHTPSFAVQTPLDRKIKFNLVKDTLVLMNCHNKQLKRQLYEKSKNYSINRVKNGVRQCFNEEVRKSQLQKCEKIKQQYQESNLGGYEKIFPTKSAENNIKYEKIMKKAKEYLKNTCSHQCVSTTQRKKSQEIQIDKKKFKSVRQDQKKNQTLFNILYAVKQTLSTSPKKNKQPKYFEIPLRKEINFVRDTPSITKDMRNSTIRVKLSNSQAQRRALTKYPFDFPKKKITKQLLKAKDNEEGDKKIISFNQSQTPTKQGSFLKPKTYDLAGGNLPLHLNALKYPKSVAKRQTNKKIYFAFKT